MLSVFVRMMKRCITGKRIRDNESLGQDCAIPPPSHRGSVCRFWMRQEHEHKRPLITPLFCSHILCSPLQMFWSIFCVEGETTGEMEEEEQSVYT